MNARKRAYGLILGVEIALAFSVGAAVFALVAVTLAVVNSGVLVFVLGAACIVAVVAMVRFWGVAYAIPALMAALVAFDWYRFPPTHPGGFPSSGDLADLIAYLAVAALVGELAAYAGRRADVSEGARSELAEEQAALRRVATLVARGESPNVVFAAVAEETGVLLGVDGARVIRYVGEDEVVLLAGWTAPGFDWPVLGRQPLEASPLAKEVLRTGHAARIDDYLSADRGAPEIVRKVGVNSGVGAPIVVDGRIWGALGVWFMHAEPLPDAAEARLAGFTELVATAISNASSREQLARLADEQAALLRVATLVARGVPPPELFEAVAEELGLLLGVGSTHMFRYETADTLLGVGSWSGDGTHVPVGTRAPLDDTGVAGLVFTTGRPARLDNFSGASGHIAALSQSLGVRSAVGAPIVVDGDLWGVMIVSSTEEQVIPADTESRIAAFTRLVATAISNTEARAEVRRLADEQAALRRVATLVAREASPAEVFDKVAEEVALLLGVETALMERYEPDGTATVVAHWGELDAFPVGTSMNLEGDNVTGLVRRTGRPARIDDYAAAEGPLAAAVRSVGVGSAVGGPIVVDGQLWGAVAAGSLKARPLPADAESHIAEFTELVATSIANIQARGELAASRARIVAATDDERRRVVRDLHDGAQQRLVHTVITLKLARRALEKGDEAAPSLVSEALVQAESATAELRELAHGILPAVLTSGGLRAGVHALASRAPIPVEIAVCGDRFPAAVEATAYYVVAEALTNVAKHSHAEHATVIAGVAEGALQVEIADDGTGEADPNGHGLLGLADRVASRDGVLQVVGAPGEGTRVIATLPLAA